MDTPQAVSERSSLHPEPPRDPIEIGTAQAHTSRIYDYLLGGTDNFAIDREVAEHAFAAYPGGVDGARSDARANRAFLGRAVRFLADAGIRQFLDIGTGIPNSDNVHAVLERVALDARVVYVDNDPIVLAHAHALLARSDRAAYVDGDLCEAAPILHRAADTLDFGKPVAVLLFGILHVIPDSADPFGAVATFVRSVVPGSYLAISHMTADVQPAAMAEVFDRLDETTRDTNPPAFRSKDEVSRFFTGLDPVDPGLVQVGLWRPDPKAGSSRPGARVPPLYAAVARKP
jgi:S-adenosyl methyltransferase